MLLLLFLVVGCSGVHRYEGGNGETARAITDVHYTDVAASVTQHYDNSLAKTKQ